MTPEIEAAAERVRRVRSGESTLDVYRIPGFGSGEQYLKELGILADAYLASLSRPSVEEVAERLIELVMAQANRCNDATQWDQRWTEKEFGRRPIDLLRSQFCALLEALQLAESKVLESKGDPQ